MEYKKLFEPITINGCVIPNRLVVPAMVVSLCTEEGYATERYIKYHEEKAKGGWGLIITEDYAVNRHAGGYKHIAGLYRDDQIEGHKKMVDAVHAHGSKVFCQIYHAGRQASNDVNGGMQPVAPSPLPSPWNREMPRALTVDEIHQIVQDFGTTAARAKKAGFDGIEVHAAHGYLLAEFMSYFVNKRTDEYGGCFTNRMRLVHEVYDAVRAAVGPDFPVIVRFSAMEETASGRAIAESRMIAKLFEEWGFDAINCSNGVYSSFITGTIGTSFAPNAWTIDNAAELKKVVDIPVFAANRINDPMMADQLIDMGYCDMVGMARGSLADPHLPNKACEGRLDEINYCIGCIQGCAPASMMQMPVRCLVNPGIGREYELTYEPAEQKKRVLVVGGGVAGMQAAIAAAKRGHDVTLWEKSQELGGQFISASYPPAKGNYITYVCYLKGELERSGAKVELGKTADADAIRSFGADKVILAAGGRPKIPDLPGIDKPNVLYPEQILLGEVNPEGRICILGGGSNGVETAAHLADLERGDITVVARRYTVADHEGARQVPLRKFCEDHWIHFLLGHQFVEITDEGVILSHEGVQKLQPCDWVVIAMGYESCNELASELDDLGDALVVVGDALECHDALVASEQGLQAGHFA